MALIGQAVSEEKIFEIVDGRTTDGRTPDHGHPISSPCEPNGSGELKNTPTSTTDRQTDKTRNMNNNLIISIEFWSKLKQTHTQFP